MAPVEFEKELKKRLRSREVPPSSEAWQRIASRLDDEDPGQGRSSGWWIGLAAASVLMLAALAFFWERPESLPAMEPVVSAPAEEAPVEDPGPEVTSVELISEAEGAINVATSEKEEPGPSVRTEKRVPETLQQGKQGLAAAPVQDASPLADPDLISGLVAGQMDTILAAVVALEQANEPVNDAQIEALLREAQQTIIREGEPEDRSAVDPMILLAQAEEELDQTFREQILQKLRTEYSRIRNSVADRNK